MAKTSTSSTSTNTSSQKPSTTVTKNDATKVSNTYGNAYTTGESKSIFNKSDVLNYLDGLYGSANTKAGLDKSNPFGYMTDQQSILNALNDATNTSYDEQEQKSRQNLAAVDNTNYANRANTIANAKNALLSGVQTGAATGANSAAIMQALMAGDASAANASTTALQELQNIASQRQSALAGNVNTAITTANAAKGQQASAAEQQYAADTATQQAALSALGEGVKGMTQTTDKTYQKDQIGQTTTGGGSTVKTNTGTTTNKNKTNTTNTTKK